MREYQREYYQKPEVKAKRREYDREYRAKKREYMREYQREYQREYYQKPEMKAKQHEYMREYRQKPEVKAKKREYNQKPEVKAKKREYDREYKQKPEVKAKKREYDREYYQKPEVKAKQREYMREYQCEYYSKHPRRVTVEPKKNDEAIKFWLADGFEPLKRLKDGTVDFKTGGLKMCDHKKTRIKFMDKGLGVVEFDVCVPCEEMTIV